MKWWWRKKGKTPTSDKDGGSMAAADQAVRDARTATRRVDNLAESVLPGLRRLEAHRAENHILDAMMNKIVRRP
jgi:hypothetical protein